jgi:hypothetical protein
VHFVVIDIYGASLQHADEMRRSGRAPGRVMDEQAAIPSI